MATLHLLYTLCSSLPWSCYGFSHCFPPPCESPAAVSGVSPARDLLPACPHSPKLSSLLPRDAQDILALPSPACLTLPCPPVSNTEPSPSSRKEILTSARCFPEQIITQTPKQRAAGVRQHHKHAGHNNENEPKQQDGSFVPAPVPAFSSHTPPASSHGETPHCRSHRDILQC